ncbi:small subunit of acetolactate synthase-domain-containing protein [Lactarius quietus]|nr:small subunit of acetolactate synthase-domain-containing protein [Lactarius quietus]
MLPARALVVSKTLFTTRRLSTTARILSNGTPPKRPPPIDDSTSALNYKTSHKVWPPPLPKMDEAVTNMLYNTPPPGLQPFKKHVLNCLVQNEPGVLSRVSGILAGRRFNIDSLVVCRTEIRDLSRMCIAISGQDGVVEQSRRQLEDRVRSHLPHSILLKPLMTPPSVPVWAVLDYTETRMISRELLLVKVTILRPECLDDQLIGGPSHEPRPRRADQARPRNALTRHFEETTRPPAPAPAPSIEEGVDGGGKPLTPSEARHQHLRSLHTLANQFGARIVDVSDHSVVVEIAGKTTHVEAFLALVKPYGIIESARVGLIAMPRIPIAGLTEEDDASKGDSVDANLPPPG